MELSYMKKKNKFISIIIFKIILSCSNTLKAQDSLNVTDKVCDSNLGKKYFLTDDRGDTIQVFSKDSLGFLVGELIFYEKDKPVISCCFKNRKLHGSFFVYYKNGNLKSTTIYKFGKLMDKKTFYKTGELKVQYLPGESKDIFKAMYSYKKKW